MRGVVIGVLAALGLALPSVAGAADPARGVAVQARAQVGTRIRIEKLLRITQAARTANPYDLPDFGSGPSAGQTAPTVTASGTVTAANTKAYTLDDADPGWANVIGGTPVVAAAGSPNYYGFPVVTQSTAAIASTGKAGVGWGIEFCTDDPNPNIRIGYNSLYAYRILVDGQFLTRAPTAIPNPNAGGNIYFQINFGVRKWRCYRYESEGAAFFRSVLVQPTSRVAAPARAAFLRAAWVGDSYAAYQTQAGTANSFAQDNYAGFTGRLLGLTDLRQTAAPGTGFSTDVASSLRYSSAARIADVASLCALPGGLDMIVAQGSINDRTASTGQIATDAAIALKAWRAACPGVPIIVLGAAPGSTGPSAAVIAAEAQYAASVAAFGDPLVKFVGVSTVGPTPVIFGTGTVAATNASGNSDLFTQSDGLHPSFGANPGAAGSAIGGMEYLARNAAAGIRAALASMN